jgi:hypothetical protein
MSQQRTGEKQAYCMCSSGEEPDLFVSVFMVGWNECDVMFYVIMLV